MRKIRREVLKTINDLRAKFDDRWPLNIDEHANKAADEYAFHLLSEEPSEAHM
jgi:hypothetical protein